jgi:transcription initiation factor TFIID TATA-box-binding protein
MNSDAGNQLEVVNIVGSGAFQMELDLNTLTKELGEKAEYEPEIYPAMYLQVGQEDGPHTTVYRTGKFIIVGASSEDELYSTKEKVVETISKAIGSEVNSEWFQIQNYVCTGNLNKELDLNTLSVDLGLEQTEYEPEQFGGIIYKPNIVDCTVLIFRTGKIVVTGGQSFKECVIGFEEVESEIQKLFSDDKSR